MINSARSLSLPVILLALASIAIGCGKEGAGSSGSSGSSANGADTLNIPGNSGLVTMNGAGPKLGSWSFENSYASLREQPVAGATRHTLTVEAHQLSSDTHFKLRFMRDDEELETGNYSIDRPQGEPPRKLDATFEIGSQIYKPIQGSIGNAEITMLTDHRVKGNFSVKLTSLADPTKSESLVGTFDARLQRADDEK